MKTDRQTDRWDISHQFTSLTPPPPSLPPLAPIIQKQTKKSKLFPSIPHHLSFAPYLFPRLLLRGTVFLVRAVPLALLANMRQHRLGVVFVDVRLEVDVVPVVVLLIFIVYGIRCTNRGVISSGEKKKKRETEKKRNNPLKYLGAFGYRSSAICTARSSPFGNTSTGPSCWSWSW